MILTGFTPDEVLSDFRAIKYKPTRKERIYEYSIVIAGCTIIIVIAPILVCSTIGQVFRALIDRSTLEAKLDGLTHKLYVISDKLEEIARAKGVHVEAQPGSMVVVSEEKNIHKK